MKCRQAAVSIAGKHSKFSQKSPCSFKTVALLLAILGIVKLYSDYKLAGISLALASAACTAATIPARRAPTSRAPIHAPYSALSRSIDSVVRAAIATRNIPGVSVAVLRRDTVIHTAGYGLARIDRPVPVTPHTVFQIASLTKPFTAMAVLMLVDEGKIQLDAPASRYLAELPGMYSSITIRQLLTHTSGIAPDMRRANVDEMELAEFWRRLGERPPSAAPGAAIQYANTGYAVLSFVVERVSGIPFGEFLRRRIFAPLAMTHSSYRVPQQNDAAHARGYDLVDGRSVEAPHVFSGWGNSGIETTAEDLSHWAAAIERRELLSKASYEQMFAPGKLASGAPNSFRFGSASATYGFGWFLLEENGRRVQTHGGAIAGFSSIVNRYPDAGYTIIVLSNSKQGSDRLGQADGVARAIAPVLGL